jgi:hypothetical protein
MDKLQGAFKSLTIWANVIILSLLPLAEHVAQNLSALQPYLPENTYKTLAFWAVLINIVLRFKTSKPLNEK